MTFNAQVSKGFRLGGVNDPLNLPLCGPTAGAMVVFSPDTFRSPWGSSFIIDTPLRPAA